MSFASHRGRNASFSSVTEAFPLLRAQEQEAERASGSGFGGAGGADKQEKLWALMASYLASDVHSIQRSVANHVEYTLAGSRFHFDRYRAYLATAHSIRDRLIESWCVARRKAEMHAVPR